jgi:hypothetical protein
MGTKELARAIERDLLRTETKTKAPECFACGRPFLPKPSTGDDNTHAFCSPRCREAYDNGFPAYDPAYTNKTNPRWYSLPMGRHGFLIPCAGCGKEFDSKGLRCCSPACERRYRGRSESEDLMTEVGMDKPVKRKCDQCGGDIPNWRNGRRVRSRFCSQGCNKRYAKQLKTTDLVPEAS